MFVESSHVAIKFDTSVDSTVVASIANLDIDPKVALLYLNFPVPGSDIVVLLEN